MHLCLRALCVCTRIPAAYNAGRGVSGAKPALNNTAPYCVAALDCRVSEGGTKSCRGPVVTEAVLLPELKVPGAGSVVVSPRVEGSCSGRCSLSCAAGGQVALSLVGRSPTPNPLSKKPLPISPTSSLNFVIAGFPLDPCAYCVVAR